MRSLNIAFLWLAVATCRAATESGVRFPADAGVVDVTRPPYHAKGDGATDATAALQRALDDHPARNRILYLPDGVYLISDTLRWPEGPGEGAFMKRAILQGQSRAGTVLRLKDHCAGFGEGGRTEEGRYGRPDGKAMLWTGRAPAQRFRNAVRNLTLDTGCGNPGAIGARFMANNQGGVFDVTIRSGDGAGRIGLDLGFAHENGPLLVQNVSVEGFDIGVYAWGAVNSLTLVDVSLSRQREVGILNAQQVLSLENLVSRNGVPALRNADPSGVVTLVGADLRAPDGVRAEAAVENRGALHARDVRTMGYARAVANAAGHRRDAPGPDVADFVSHAVLSLPGEDAPATGLRLPVRRAPDIPWDPLEQWASPLAFGASPGGGDCAEALQRAIDSGATTVYLPNGTWTLAGTVHLRGRVRRLIGCEAQLTGEAVLQVDDGEAPAVRIERLEIVPTRDPSVRIRHASFRTLVLANLRMSRAGAYEAAAGAGALFIEDVAGDPWAFAPGQNVWARQLNPESSHHTMLVNRGANLWILGLKTEGDGPVLEAYGGATEWLGAFIYSNTGRPKKDLVALDNAARFSATMGEASFRGQPFQRLVVVHRDGASSLLSRDQTPRRGEGSLLPLFVRNAATDGGIASATPPPEPPR